jgi:hypothetical protein
MACFVIGDSLGVGVGAALPECIAEARVGVTSAAYLPRPSRRARW